MAGPAQVALSGAEAAVLQAVREAAAAPASRQLLSIHVVYRDGHPWLIQVHFADGSCREVAVNLPEKRPYSEIQEAILEALNGRALRAVPLAAAIKRDKRRLYDHPGGIQELLERGEVRLHRGRGYWRPDTPPPDMPKHLIA